MTIVTSIIRVTVVTTITVVRFGFSVSRTLAQIMTIVTSIIRVTVVTAETIVRFSISTPLSVPSITMTITIITTTITVTVIMGISFSIGYCSGISLSIGRGSRFRLVFGFIGTSFLFSIPSISIAMNRTGIVGGGRAIAVMWISIS